MGISRVAVRKVLHSNSNAVPEIHRVEKAESHRQQILELFDRCKGNLVRVDEELVAGGAQLSYTALTEFCWRHGIGYAPPTPAGQYAFAPGEHVFQGLGVTTAGAPWSKSVGGGTVGAQPHPSRRA
jgi:hypothetical protein